MMSWLVPQGLWRIHVVEYYLDCHEMCTQSFYYTKCPRVRTRMTELWEDKGLFIQIFSSPLNMFQCSRVLVNYCLDVNVMMF